MRTRAGSILASATATALVAVAVVLAPSAPSAHAQASGLTDIDITLPDIVVLHYFGNVDVSVTKNALGTFLTGTAGDSDVDEGTGTPTAGGFTQDVAISPTLSGDPTAAVLRLNNIWGVRSISLAGGTDTQLQIANTDDTLDHVSTAATITIDSIEIDDGSSSGTTITFGAPGLSNPILGAVEMILDLSNATNAGEYQDGAFTLTAQNI